MIIRREQPPETETDPRKRLVVDLLRVDLLVHPNPLEHSVHERVTYSTVGEDGVFRSQELSFMPSVKDGRVAVIRALTVTEGAEVSLYYLMPDDNVVYYAPGSNTPEWSSPARLEEMADKVAWLAQNLEEHPEHCMLNNLPLRTDS